ncbi:hypothetical protein V8D89_009914 [Ganoderma adspersum]
MTGTSSLGLSGRFLDACRNDEILTRDITRFKLRCITLPVAALTRGHESEGSRYHANRLQSFRLCHICFTLRNPRPREMVKGTVKGVIVKVTEVRLHASPQPDSNASALTRPELELCWKSRRPDKATYLELARKVNAILQCHCYTAQKAAMHFYYLRRRDSKNLSLNRRAAGKARGQVANAAALSTGGARNTTTGTGTGTGMGTSTAATDSDHSVVARLDTMLAREPTPSPEVARVWADVLAQGVRPEDVLVYALLRQAKYIAEREGADADADADTQAASTATPISSESKSPAWASHPSVSPVLGHDGAAPAPLHGQPESPSPSSPGLVYYPHCHGQPLDAGADIEFPQELATQLRRALSAPVGPHPRTFADLCAWLHGGCGSGGVPVAM